MKKRMILQVILSGAIAILAGLFLPVIATRIGFAILLFFTIFFGQLILKLLGIGRKNIRNNLE